MPSKSIEPASKKRRLPRRPPIDPRPAPNGRVGVAMSRACNYHLLTRDQAIDLAIGLMRCVQL